MFSWPRESLEVTWALALLLIADYASEFFQGPAPSVVSQPVAEESIEILRPIHTKLVLVTSVLPEVLHVKMLGC